MLILCIDDDQDDISFFIEAMKNVSSATTCMSVLDGREAIDLISSISNDQKLPDYIFLDINMSPMNGKEILKEIRKMDKCKQVEIVMLSTGLGSVK